MLMRVAVCMNVLRRRLNFMNMYDAEGVVFVGQARRCPRSVAERKGDARRQNAKHIDESKQPSLPSIGLPWSSAPASVVYLSPAVCTAGGQSNCKGNLSQVGTLLSSARHRSTLPTTAISSAIFLR